MCLFLCFSTIYFPLKQQQFSYCRNTFFLRYFGTCPSSSVDLDCINVEIRAVCGPCHLLGQESYIIIFSLTHSLSHTNKKGQGADDAST